jgi:hypothetical protein
MMSKLLATAAAVTLAVVMSQPVRSASVLIEPAPNARIENRLSFAVTGAIESYDRDREQHLHYWVSIATVAPGGAPDVHWPKFYVKKGQFTGRVSDGGQNPYSKPQEMLLLLLKVDDATSQQFERWLATGISLGYPGLRPNPGDIVAQVPITFP